MSEPERVVLLHRELSPTQAATRERVLDAVVRLATASGYDGFSMRELAARVRAVLRRASKQQTREPEFLRAADVAVNLPGRTVTVGEKIVELTPSEFDLLVTLIGEPGRAFSRTELLERLQGDSYEGYERTIDVHIRNLRGKIEPEPRQPRYVETVYGFGYRFSTAPLSED